MRASSTRWAVLPRRALLGVLALSGCLEPPGERLDVGPWGSDASPGELADGSDAAPQAEYFGTYAVTWTRTGGDCSGETNAMDRVDVAFEMLAFWSESCPAIEPESGPASWSGSNFATGEDFGLEHCSQDYYDQMSPVTLAFVGDSFSTTEPKYVIKRRVSDNLTGCASWYVIEGTKL